MFFLLALAFLIGARFLVHLVVEGRVRSIRAAKGSRDVLIVGGGDGGRLVVRELIRNPQLRLRPVGFVDDDPRKRGSKDEHGLKVLGTTDSEDLARILDEVEPDEVVIAIPSAPGTLRARVVAACRARGIPVRTTPTVFELLQDGSGHLNVTVRRLREVRVEDVLGRAPVEVELAKVARYLNGRTVMVTGAGGSIGSELCRQVAALGVRRLVMVDHSENNLFEIELELRDHGPTHLVAVIADCKDEASMAQCFEEHRPQIVFHAAAYKHVPMMEHNPLQAIANNALATNLLADLAERFDVERFCLISTDKAVEPKTVMGATKALAERVIEARASPRGRASRRSASATSWAARGRCCRSSSARSPPAGR